MLRVLNQSLGVKHPPDGQLTREALKPEAQPSPTPKPTTKDGFAPRQQYASRSWRTQTYVLRVLNQSLGGKHPPDGQLTREALKPEAQPSPTPKPTTKDRFAPRQQYVSRSWRTPDLRAACVLNQSLEG